MKTLAERTEVQIPAGDVTLAGELRMDESTGAIVVFAHGSGSSRHSPRNQFVAGVLRERGLGTLLFDLLTPEEGEIDFDTAHLRFDIGFLAERLGRATGWLLAEWPGLSPIGYFGASTGAAAAIVASRRHGPAIGAIVSRGGRADLSGDALAGVTAPTLLLVGERDSAVVAANESAYAALRCEKKLHVVPGATHLFEEPGALDEVAREAAEWFGRHLRPEGG
jgi:putative phosphoribosyl transferase